jgi:hypothetical protein
MLTNVDKTIIKTQRIKVNYHCSICDYNTSHKNDYRRHLATQKHIFGVNVDNLLTSNVSSKNKECSCDCGKIYKHRQSLSIHRKTCIKQNEIEIKPSDLSSDLIMMIVDKCKAENSQLNEQLHEKDEQLREKDEQLQEKNNQIIEQLKEQLMEKDNQIKEMLPKIGNTILTNNIQQNNHVQNINVFLNENCKDAINIDDFVKAINVSVNNLLLTKAKGICEGITTIVVDSLNTLPYIRRPFWCVDKKRRRIFIKDGTWIEDENNVKTKAAIKRITVLQTKSIGKYLADKPNWMENDREKETYLAIVKQSTDEIEGKEDKIIDNIVSEAIHLTSEKRASIMGK